MTPTNTQTHEERRLAAAKIVDPLPWSDDWVGMPVTREARREASLAKADQLLSLFPESGGQAEGCAHVSLTADDRSGMAAHLRNWMLTRYGKRITWLTARSCVDGLLAAAPSVTPHKGASS